MNFLNCLGYLLIVGIAIFLIGRLFPRRWISADRFIFRSFAFEKEGKIYDKIKISKWKTKLPDMSVLITKIIPRFMKKKRVETGNIEDDPEAFIVFQSLSRVRFFATPWTAARLLCP